MSACVAMPVCRFVGRTRVVYSAHHMVVKLIIITNQAIPMHACRSKGFTMTLAGQAGGEGKVVAWAPISNHHVS